MSKVGWTTVSPQFEAYQQTLDKYADIKPCHFMDLQPRVMSAIQSFSQLQNSLCRILTVLAADNALYRALIQEQIRKIDPSAPVIQTESLRIDELFDRFSVEKNTIACHKDGLLSQADGGYLIVSANLLLANPRSWNLLKSALLREPVAPQNTSHHRLPSESMTPRRFDVRIVVIGDLDQLGELDYFDSDFQSGLRMFCEIEGEIEISQQNFSRYLGYTKWLTQRYQLPELNADAVLRLCIAGVRETEDQHYLPLGIMWHNTLLSLAAIESQGQPITYQDIDAALDNKYQRESYLPMRAIDDIINGQVIIETNGWQVGQINGLTVVEVAGHPVPYGEPARISCVIHFGDGDVSDVERKAELGGNLHAKGMMIMHAFLSSALQLDEALPYSASVVFEQSYSEVDGDSASLAELCSLVSALSEYPVNQQIAVTGAVDQFGRVQAVGGLNEKIESFYRVCKYQGFTGSQGVILPHSNLRHLALHKDVVESIKSGEFSIWSVANVDEAIPIIMGKPFKDEKDSVIERIAERIEIFERNEHRQTLVQRFKNCLLRH